MNQAKFAKELGVTHPLVSLSESGDREPSTDMLVRLGKFAVNKRRYEDAKWFWEKAGIDMKALDPFIDEQMRQRRATPAGGNTSATSVVEVKPLDPSVDETIFFPENLLPNPASTRFLRVDVHEKNRKHVKSGGQFADIHALSEAWQNFNDGDILLIDTADVDLEQMGNGTCVVSVTTKGRTYLLLVGALSPIPLLSPFGARREEVIGRVVAVISREKKQKVHFHLVMRN